MINYPKHAIALQKTAYLALSLEPSTEDERRRRDQLLKYSRKALHVLPATGI